MTTDDRKRRGAWYTPPDLVAEVVDAAIDGEFVRARADRPIRVVDPACGDGRFLAAAAARVAACGGSVAATGIDIDRPALDRARAQLADAPGIHSVDVVHGDALRVAADPGWRGRFDVVLGNPPFLSQMAAATTRGGASALGGGPYADVAVEFLALGADLASGRGGRLAFVLPQSLLAVRDAADVRERIDRRARMIWSAWTGRRDFDAQVLTCAVAFEFGRPTSSRRTSWSHVVTERTGVPALPAAISAPTNGTLGDRAWLNANFRDEYYGMIPAVGDHPHGPPLVTSGLIDPGQSSWGRRDVRFAKRRYAAPRVDVRRLDERMTRWAERRLVPKVLVANQTPVLEAVCDPQGAWLPAVPVVSAYPSLDGGTRAAQRRAWDISAVLTSPVASVWAWHQRAGSGLSAGAIRVGPTMLAALPWPAGPLEEAVAALRCGDVVACGRAVDHAYGVAETDPFDWWRPIVERLTRRASPSSALSV